jgi:hypothetical protein
MTIAEQVAIVGAGPAGVSAALSLHDRGVRPLLIDRADRVAASWRNRYDRLRLNTGRQFSHLPGRRYPAGTPLFPTRDQIVDHLERHAHQDGIEVRVNTGVTRIDRGPEGWRLVAAGGDIDARQVVVATGYEHSPAVPDWPGRDGFTGELLHSSAYKNPAPFAGRSVMVVGAGSSGMEIVHDVATGGAAAAWLSIRTPPNLFPRFGPAGLPGDILANPLYHAPVWLADAIAKSGRRRQMGDLSACGLPIPAEGPFARMARTHQAPAIIDMAVIDEIRAGTIQVVAAPQSFDGPVLTLTDGTRLEPDVVICATGYRHGLAALVGHLGVLDVQGDPPASGLVAPAPGLRFLGFLTRPSLIGFVARQSRRMARDIAAELAGEQ